MGLEIGTIIAWIIYFSIIIIFFPLALFVLYILFDSYNKFYLRLVGEGNKWYKKAFLFPVALFSWRKRNYVKKNLKNGSGENHIAIIIANNYFPENIAGFSFGAVVKLIKHLKKEGKNYRVYNKITSNQLRKVINDKNVSSVFLFGHGEKHGIKVKRNEVVYYCEFSNHPKKHLIAQFHCNHLKGKPLSEYGEEKPVYSFVTDRIQNSNQIEKQVKEIVNERFI